MADPYGECFRLLCCLWLISEFRRPRTRVVYAQAPPGALYQKTQPVYYGASADPNIAAMVAASGGDLPLLGCATMDRSEPSRIEPITDRV